MISTDLIHLPALRLGHNYTSLRTTQAVDCRTGEPQVDVSQVNAGVIRRDLQNIAASRAALRGISMPRLLGICREAGELFLEGTLPLGEGGARQSPEDYARCLSATSGLPRVMVRRNMEKIHSVLVNMPEILAGLTRGLDLEILDSAGGRQNGVPITYFPATSALGVIMPSNSPAVNSLWLPAIALKVPVVLKPGRDEPWTPYRLIQAFLAAGCPPAAFGFYPTDHEGSASILELCGRAMLFGDKHTIDRYAGNPAVQAHGPGFSKILFGEDQIADWRRYVDLMVASISDNGGRSCINASTVVVPAHGREIAEALARELGPVVPMALDDEKARLSSFANPRMAEAIDAALEEGLKTPGAEEMTAPYRNGSRLVKTDDGVFMRPTIVYCDCFEHPLANREFLFPYASVVEVPQAEMLDRIGDTLVVSAITREESFIRQLMDSPHIDRLNVGPVSTMKISWDQPHEGNLFEFLYRRRAYENGWEARS